MCLVTSCNGLILKTCMLLAEVSLHEQWWTPIETTRVIVEVKNVDELGIWLWLDSHMKFGNSRFCSNLDSIENSLTRDWIIIKMLLNVIFEQKYAIKMLNAFKR